MITALVFYCFLQSQIQHFWPSVPHLNCKSAPSGIGTTSTPTPCRRNYLCITPTLSINKRYLSQSVPGFLELGRNGLSSFFLHAGKKVFFCVEPLGCITNTSDWKNKNNAPGECVKDCHLLLSTVYTQTVIYKLSCSYRLHVY